MPLLGLLELRNILRDYSGDAPTYLGVRVGSQVYGTATPDSDTDFIVVGQFEKDNDLLFGRDYNVTLYSVAAFEKALAEQSVYALEGLFAPGEHRLLQGPDFIWQLNEAKLRAKSASKSGSDWGKGLKLLRSDPDKARKKLFHALRVPDFTRQLIEHGEIRDFTSANCWYEEILTEPSDEPGVFEDQWGSIRQALCQE